MSTDHGVRSGEGAWCRLCHKAWPCPDVSGVAALEARVAQLEGLVSRLLGHGNDTGALMPPDLENAQIDGDR